MSPSDRVVSFGCLKDVRGRFHLIEDDLAEGWVEAWVEEGVEALDEYLAKHLAFLSYLDDVAAGRLQGGPRDASRERLRGSRATPLR